MLRFCALLLALFATACSSDSAGPAPSKTVAFASTTTPDSARKSCDQFLAKA